MILNRLHHQLIAAMAGLNLLVIAAVGLTLHWSIRQSLENALGEKLLSVAATLASVYSADDLLPVTPATGPRLSRHYQQILEQNRKAAGLKRIYFFTRDLRCILDTDTAMQPGQTYYHLQFFPEAMAQTQAGHAAHSPLFTDMGGMAAMSGFAPLKRGSTVIGGIGVDGDAAFLDTVRDFNRHMLILGTAATLLAIALAILITRTLARPIAGLVNVSRQIGAGNYEMPVPESRTREIGQLARTLESMRLNILHRENELKAMVAAVAHEIRNPLGGIELFTGLLHDELGGSPAAVHLNRIQSEIRYLNDIVHRFLEFAKPETPQRELCKLSQIIRMAVESLAPEIQNSGVECICHFPDREQPVTADPTHIRRIFLNLLQNSLHAAGPGGRIHISMNQNRHRTMLRMEDNGCGIPEAARDKIFNAFFTTREKGTGLGLAIVKRLTEAADGRIRLVQTGPEGTVFEIELPVI